MESAERRLTGLHSEVTKTRQDGKEGLP